MSLTKEQADLLYVCLPEGPVAGLSDAQAAVAERLVTRYLLSKVTGFNDDSIEDTYTTSEAGRVMLLAYRNKEKRDKDAYTSGWYSACDAAYALARTYGAHSDLADALVDMPCDK